MYMTILFFALEGFTVPNFFEFIYYYSVNEKKMSQLEWGLGMVMITIAIMVMIGIYATFLKDKEPRTLILLSILFFFTSALCQQIFVAGYYKHLQLDQYFFLILGVMFPLGFGIAITHLVPLAVLGKITPSHVEATIFAFATSVIKGSRSIGGFCFASLLNYLFIGMTATDLKKLYIALFMMMGFRLLVLTYIWMIPTLAEVKKVQ